MRSLKDFIAALGLLASLGANALAGPLVVCVGDGGHVSLESALADCCPTLPHDDHREAPAPDDGFRPDRSGSCGACQDLPVPASPATAPATLVRGGMSHWAPVEAMILAAAPNDPAPPARGSPPLPPRGSLESLRTTILRR